MATSSPDDTFVPMWMSPGTRRCRSCGLCGSCHRTAAPPASLPRPLLLTPLKRLAQAFEGTLLPQLFGLSLSSRRISPASQYSHVRESMSEEGEDEEGAFGAGPRRACQRTCAQQSVVRCGWAATGPDITHITNVQGRSHKFATSNSLSRYGVVVVAWLPAGPRPAKSQRGAEGRCMAVSSR